MWLVIYLCSKLDVIFESYNKTTKKAKCNCDVQTNSTETDISKIEFSSTNIATSFITTLKNSNFLVLKCYKLAISLKNIIKNKGRIIMTIIYFFFLFCLLIFLIRDRKKINMFINLILKNKGIMHKEFKNKMNHKEEKKNIKNINNDKIIKNNKKIENKDKKNKKNAQKNDKNSKNNKKKEKDKEKKVNKISKINVKKKDKNKLNPKIKSRKNINNKEPPKKKSRNKEAFNNLNRTINTNINSNTHMSLKTKNKEEKIHINIIPINNIKYGKLQKKKQKKRTKILIFIIQKAK